jgi:methylenetetrahydrofolate reductase (NADPH)
MAERFEGLEDDPETHALVASAVAAEQVIELLDEGVTEFHIYTLNRSNLALALARLLGKRPD